MNVQNGPNFASTAVGDTATGVPGVHAEPVVTPPVEWMQEGVGACRDLGVLVANRMVELAEATETAA